MQTATDVVAKLGYLALGTRLKRLAEQLQTGVAELLSEHGQPVQPGQLPLLVAIADQDGLTVAQLVQAVGVSQPAVSRMLGGLQRSRLVTLSSDPDDARLRRAALTPLGKALLEQIRGSIFTSVEPAVEQLCDGTDILAAISTIEDRNRELPFPIRLRKIGE